MNNIIKLLFLMYNLYLWRRNATDRKRTRINTEGSSTERTESFILLYIDNNMDYHIIINQSSRYLNLLAFVPSGGGEEREEGEEGAEEDGVEEADEEVDSSSG